MRASIDAKQPQVQSTSAVLLPKLLCALKTFCRTFVNFFYNEFEFTFNKHFGTASIANNLMQLNSFTMSLNVPKETYLI